ncbi:MAG: PD-(D/E)XK nuclease family protein [Actinobacteria bacterium]|nr:PD-(D/E)XK nuclease family protein [Actinomycetota bacterium]
MPLKLVTGPANSAKAGVVLDAFRARRRQEPWLVVPTLDDVAAFERELTGEGATRAGRVTTFAGLARELARRAGWWARPVGPLQRERLVAQAIAAAPLAALAPVADAPGFLGSTLAFVAELERSLITPQRFTAAVRAWPEATPAAHEAAAIYDRYMRALERLGRVDPELFAWRALDALRARPGAWGTTPVLLYGFDDLTPLERDAVETLAKIADAEVTVSLTYESGRAAFAGRAAALVQELGQLAADVVALPAEDAHYAPDARAALHHLERHLFEPGAPSVPAGHAVELLVAGGERAEAELVAAELLRLLHDEQVAAESVAVVLRTPERGAALLEEVLAAYGVPYALQRRVPFAHTALGRGLLALARCALHADAARPADLLAYLRTPGRLERLELADRLELTVRRRAIADLDGARRAWEEAPGGWPLRELDRLRGAAADGPQPLLAALAREARALLAAPHKGRAAQLDPAEEVDAHALAALLRALEELAELAAADPRRAPDADALLQALERLAVPVGTPPRPGAVVVTDPLAIRARRFDTVILCGLQEGEFPRPAAPEPFLSDEERRALNAATGLRLAAREDRLAEERHLFYAAVSRATRRLVLSCRDADEEGNPALPSFFLDDVRALLDELPARHRPLSEVTWPLDAAPTALERARAEALAAPRETPPPLASLGDEARAALRQRELLSAGGLEAYARCPVRWLVERELAPDRFEPDPEAIARGSCVHRVLERVLAQLDWPLARGALPAAEPLVRTVVAEEAARLVLGRGPAAQAAAAHEIAADVLRLLRHEADGGGAFAPAELELAFGFDDALGPLVLGDGALRLRGVIDRVDLDRAGRALVRDYKSGRKGPGWPVARWRAEDQLQVALYMVAVRELLRREPVGGVYQPLRGEDLRARGLVRDDADTGELVVDTDRRSQEELEAELDAAAARACELAARLRGGELCATPETCSPNGCAYPGICRAADQ